MERLQITIGVTIFAFLLDFIIGDPQNPMHPIRLVGAVISKWIKLAEKIAFKSNRKVFYFGMFMTLATVLTFFVGTAVLLGLLYQIQFYIGFVVEGILGYFMLAARALYTEASDIHAIVKRGNLEKARERLSYIVGRDTKELSFEQIIKATIETVAENLSDGVIAPILYMMLGGAPLAVAYKVINTFDSMVGYRNERFEYLGKFAAKLDDVVNFIPARLSAVFMMLACLFYRKDTIRSIKIYCRDRKNHSSPNSAHTESVCAGALGLQLGGTSYYGGKAVVKPSIGDEVHRPIAKHMLQAGKLMYISAFVPIVLATIVLYLFLFPR